MSDDRNAILVRIVAAEGGTVRDPNNRNKLLEDILLARGVTPTAITRNGLLGEILTSYSFVGLYDVITGMSWGLDPQLLRSAYTGDAKNVQRQSDDVDDDIGFIANNYDTAAHNTFIGGSTGETLIGYDQIGSDNATETAPDVGPVADSDGFDVFNGVDARLVSSHILTDGDNLSLMFSSKQSVWTNGDRFMGWDNGGSKRNVVFQVFSSDKIVIISWTSGSALISFDVPDSKTDGEEHWYVPTYDSAIGWVMYYDGAPLNISGANDTGTLDIASPANLSIGGKDAGGGNYFDGSLGTRAVYQAKTLTQSDVTSLYTQVLSNRGVKRPIYQESTTLPDGGSGSDAGKGWTCTGIAYDAVNDCWWVGNDGRNVEGDLTFESSIIQLSKDMTTILSQITISDDVTTPESIQGVAIDTSDDTIWAACSNPQEILHYEKDGTYLGSIVIGKNVTGVAYDSVNDNLILCVTGEAEIQTWSKAGSELSAYSLDLSYSGWDGLWLDTATNYLYQTVGSNKVDGQMLVIDNSTGTTLEVYDLRNSKAVEGLVFINNDLYICNDQYFHDATPKFNQIMKYSFTR